MSDVTDTAPPDTLFVSVREAAKRLGMSIDVTYDLVKGGHLAYVQHKPHGKIHVVAADLLRYAEENAVRKPA
jgi:predicted site-specific integrase-resolvase